jgi:hypothetical protein
VLGFDGKRERLFLVEVAGLPQAFEQIEAEFPPR